MAGKWHSPFGKEIGIDLGTASVLVYIRGKGLVLQEPSVVTIDKHSDKVLSVGFDAQDMLGRTPGDIVAARPLRSGVISDFAMTERMLRAFLRKVSSRRLFKPRLVICVPCGITEVEERAVIDAGIQAGARRVFLMEEPLAAAIGAGLSIELAEGQMIVDIGGGTTDIAVIALSAIVESASLRVAGDQFDEALVKYLRRKHNALIGSGSAEDMKRSIGCVDSPKTPKEITVKGRCLTSGLPKDFTVSSLEMQEALSPVSEQILEQISALLERTPPELLSDIHRNGIVLTGGGSLLRGLDQLIARRTGIETRLAEDPVTCVIRGMGETLDAGTGTYGGARQRH